MSCLDTPPAVAVADCRCAADAAGPQPLRLAGIETSGACRKPGAPRPAAGSEVLQALRGQEGWRDEWMAGWLSTLVHSLCLDHEPGERLAEDAGQRPGQQERCLHCGRAFDFSHKRAALLILAQGRGVERHRVVEKVGRERSCSR
ncbi:pyoverdine biosynthesis protein [Pseudomonas sp. SK3(2021)]|uniref:pyoverdine biosynthesis protein n=1 Tax=Pseudomonas sp. SK3(2021) TaxID=2841064 RepID=UPI00192C0B28|nr:pyoverdine biosynthesis protein [Pseudomonas sp. SK3(2021)]QQZ40366.1 pyoverdine biosynthesis protein [Pseudomonas sp. SK3(2021)]